MSLPFFASIGKASNDLLSGGYNKTPFSVTIDTKTENGTGFNAEAVRADAVGNVSGSVTYKYSVPEGLLKGLATSAKFASSNIVSVATSYDKFANVPGLAVTATADVPLVAAGEKGPVAKGETKVSYSASLFNFDGKVAFDKSGKVGATLSAVTGTKGFSFGAQSSVDVQSRTLKAYAAGAEYKGSDYVLTSLFNTVQPAKAGETKKVSCVARYRHDVSKTVSVAGEYVHNIASSDAEGKVTAANSSFAVGSLLKLSNGATLKTKVNSDAVLAVSYSEAIRTGLVAVLSSEIDTKNKNAGKLGLALKYSA